MNKETVMLLAKCLTIVKQADDRGVFADTYMQEKVKEVLDMERRMIDKSLNREIMEPTGNPSLTEDTPPFDDGSLRKSAWTAMFGGKL